jgi:hypothetical protein
MNIRKAIAGLAATAALVALTAGSAMAVDIGTLVQTTNQNVTLTGGSTVSLLSQVYFNGTDYTYKYDLSNLTDKTGISQFAPTVSNASDFGTTGMTFFFGGAPTGVNGTVTPDGPVGNDLNNVGLTHFISGNGGNLVAFGQGSRIDFDYENPGGLKKGMDTFGQYGDFFYISTVSPPGMFDINVTDDGSADFPGPAPGVPEPSSVAGLGIGLMGILVMGFLAIRRRAGVLS